MDVAKKMESFAQKYTSTEKKNAFKIFPQLVGAIVDMYKRYNVAVNSAKGIELEVEGEQSNAELQLGSNPPAWLMNLTQISTAFYLN